MKVILPAKDIPENSKVIKINGSHKFTLKTQIEIYQKGSKKNIISIDKNCKVLFGKHGDIEIIPNEKELIWITSEDALSDYLDDRRL